MSESSREAFEQWADENFVTGMHKVKALAIWQAALASSPSAAPAGNEPTKWDGNDMPPVGAHVHYQTVCHDGEHSGIGVVVGVGHDHTEMSEDSLEVEDLKTGNGYIVLDDDCKPATPQPAPPHIPAGEVVAGQAVSDEELLRLFNSADSVIDGLHEVARALSAHQAPMMPDGYVPMPKDPNISIGFAYLDAANAADPSTEWAFSWAGYRAMVAASTQEANTEVPNACKEDIYINGNVVAVFDAGMFSMEGLIKEANRQGPEMDWHYFGGRAVVKTLGNVTDARNALALAMPRDLGCPAPLPNIMAAMSAAPPSQEATEQTGGR